MKKYETIKWLANRLEWIRQRLGYVGDKLLTLTYLLLFGLFILGYRFINMVRIKSWKAFLFVMCGTKSHWSAYRLQKRIKYDYKVLGKRDYYKEQREAEE